jgi:uncharacterized membrane protein (TIGR02234 family)
VVIVTVLAGVALVVLAAGRPWAGEAVTGVPGVPRITSTGSQAAPAATALALVAAAGAVALALTGRLARRVVAGLLILAGLGVAALVATVLSDPAQAIAPALEAATGRTAAGSRDVAGRAELTGWPWMAVVGALLILAGALTALGVAGRWGSTGRRFEAPAGGPRVPAVGGGSDGPADQSDGPADQSDGTAEQVAGQAEGRQAAKQVGRVRAPREQVLDDWDALSRGEDPTAG